MKFKTIEEVFTHNFDVLRKWRGWSSVPHRLPGALRYFVAQQLSDPEAVAKLCVDAPEDRCPDPLEFCDGSVLKLPDQVFEDQDSYDEFAFQEKLRIDLDNIQREIWSLASQTRAYDLFEKAAVLLRALESISSSPSEIVEPRRRNLTVELGQAIADAASAGQCRMQQACEWLRIVDPAEEFMNLLPSHQAQKLRAKIVLWLASEMTRLCSR